MPRRKQVSFDIDTNVAKKIFGEQSYTKIYGDILYMIGLLLTRYLQSTPDFISLPSGRVIYWLHILLKNIEKFCLRIAFSI